MSDNYLQETLQSLTSVLDHIVTEPVCEYLSWEWWDGDTCTFPLKNIPEMFEVRVATADDRVFQLEGRDVGPADDLVGGVHVAGSTMSLGVADL